MSSLARKLQAEQQQQQQKQTAAKPHKSGSGKFQITPGEKVIGLLFSLMICLGGIQIVSSQAEIYKVNKEIQEMKTSVIEQQKVNGDLEVQVGELSTYERIGKKARELGLMLNEDNVKVVQ